MMSVLMAPGATPLTQPGRPVSSDFGQMLQQALDNVNELQGTGFHLEGLHLLHQAACANIHLPFPDKSLTLTGLKQ
jgi:hypothetical protein